MKSLILTGFILYFGYGLYLYIAQQNLIYYPVRQASIQFEQRVFQNDKQQIKTTVLNKGNNKAIIYFGGNAENVDYNAEQFSQLFRDHTLYLVKYRGYAGSTGEPTEEGLYSDALHIYDEIKSAHGQISIIGRSLGSAVGTYLASEREVDKLVLITPFDSMQSVAQSHFPIYPVSLLLKEKYDSLGRVSSISAQTLIIAAEHDKIIDMQHTQRLLEGFNDEVSSVVIEGVGHNTISRNPRYYSVLKDFM